VVEQRKQAVSIRLGESDIRNIKRIARRLGVRDSDIIRFAIKSTLNRIAPLCDPGIRGRNLVPVLVESGDELIRYFELDAFHLESIINDNVEGGRQVDRDDIALLAMSGLREEYLVMRMTDGNATAVDAAAQERSLRRYLYDKYVYRSADQHRSADPHRNGDQQLTGDPHLNGVQHHDAHSNGVRNGSLNEPVFATEAGVRVQIRHPAP
jgi:hypothetical protein